jgi:hypothetical protein
VVIGVGGYGMVVSWEGGIVGRWYSGVEFVKIIVDVLVVEIKMERLYIIL